MLNDSINIKKGQGEQSDSTLINNNCFTHCIEPIQGKYRQNLADFDTYIGSWASPPKHISTFPYIQLTQTKVILTSNEHQSIFSVQENNKVHIYQWKGRSHFTDEPKHSWVSWVEMEGLLLCNFNFSMTTSFPPMWRNFPTIRFATPDALASYRMLS